MSKKGIIQVVFLTMVKALALEKSEYENICHIDQVRICEPKSEIKRNSNPSCWYTISDLFLFLPLHYFKFQILLTPRLLNLLLQSADQQPSALHPDSCLPHSPAQVTSYHSPLTEARFEDDFWSQ